METKKTRILIIYTGGTVGMIQGEDPFVPKPLNFYEIEKRIPEIRKFGFQYSILSLDPPIDSSNMRPGIWKKLANYIGDHYSGYDGFVVLHGTDTMAFTASALSFMLKNLSKPVVLTGSQLPLGEIRTDAASNILTAIEVAGAKDEEEHPLIPEVCICFDSKIFRGNRTTKVDAESFAAFSSMNYPPLAIAGISLKYDFNLLLPRAEHPLTVETEMETNVAVLSLYPGISQDWVTSALHSSPLKGLLIRTFGTGNALTDEWFIDLLREIIEEGTLVLNNTQCLGGSVNQGRYETSEYLKEIGVLSGADMTFEAAITKMMFVLGRKTSPREAKRLLHISLRGELTTE